MSAEAWGLVDVSKSYGDREVLRELSLSIGPGESVGLVGVNGAGKTTAARMLLGLERADSGAVLIPAGARLAAQFQDDRLIGHLDAVANVALGHSSTSRTRWAHGSTRAQVDTQPGLDAPFGAFAGSRAQTVARAHQASAALDAVGLAERDRHTPVRALSGGQRRRVGIARTLTAEADLVVWDEPLAGVDSQARGLVLEALQRHREGRRMLVISHVPKALRELTDRIVRL